MKKSLIIFSLFFILISCSSNIDKTNVSTWVLETPIVDNSGSTDIKKIISKDNVANHNTKEDCYTIIDDKVYDITSFFGKHPGWDDKILGLCWVDWTDKFTNKHGENEKAIMKKDTFYIWDLYN
jgi:cytochrome b involved in lipid metabolism